MRGRSKVACAVALTFIALCPVVSHAQALIVGRTPDARYDTTQLLLGNVLVSGLGAGLIGQLSGRPFWKTFAHGAAGGAVMFAGKRITASEPEPLGLLGRQVSALGASISRSAVFGSGVLDTLFLPVGPLRLSWAVGERRIAGVRIDVEDLAWAAYGLLHDRYRLDASRSLQAGALVFTTRGHLGEEDSGFVTGLTGGGAVFLSEPGLALSPSNRHHELVHVAQTDYLQIAFGAPLEQWILRVIDWDDLTLLRHVDIGIGHYPLQAALRPLLEAEAERFEGRIQSLRRGSSSIGLGLPGIEPG